MTTDADLGEAEAPRRRGRPRARTIVAAIGIPVLLVTLGVVAYRMSDTIARNSVVEIVESQIEANLPEQVTGDIRASVGGGWAPWQLIRGRFDDVTLVSDGLAVAGVPVDLRVEARDVPRKPREEIASIDATISIDAAAVASLDLPLPGGGTLGLGDGVVEYATGTTVFGVPIGAEVSAEPSADGDDVVLRPVAAEVDAGGIGVDTAPLVDAILGGEPLRVCVADRIPAAFELEGIEVTPERLTVSASAADVRVSGGGALTQGICG